MSGEKNLDVLLKTIEPKLNEGDYVFVKTIQPKHFDLENVVMLFKEDEAITLIVKKEVADALQLQYHFIASWITLTVHSALDAVGLTAAFSTALSKNDISCNVVAAFYHDHIFVEKKDTKKALEILNKLSD